MYEHFNVVNSYVRIIKLVLKNLCDEVKVYPTIATTSEATVSCFVCIENGSLVKSTEELPSVD